MLRELQAAKQPAAQAAVYAKRGVWYDALTTLAALRQQKPGDAKITADWEALLKAGGLSVFESKQLQKTP